VWRKSGELSSPASYFSAIQNGSTTERLVWAALSTVQMWIWFDLLVYLKGDSAISQNALTNMVKKARISQKAIFHL